MPYEWSSAAIPDDTLTLWPHQSLQPRGFALFIGATATLFLLPLLAVLGSVVLWLLLPFLLIALAGVWFAIHRNRRAAQISEVLTLTETHAHLMRRNPRGDVLEWDCNRHWVVPELHIIGGPVANYVTLRGNGRKVEIGAFLSEEERVALYDDLMRALRS